MVAFALVLSMAACRSGPLARKALTQDELGFRRAAIRQVVPSYPTSLLSIGVSGVAVANVALQGDGTVDHVEILQAPHRDIAEAMVTALKQWTFPPVRLPGTYLNATVSSKITYYFSVSEGRGVVRSPEEQAQFLRGSEPSRVPVPGEGALEGDEPR